MSETGEVVFTRTYSRTKPDGSKEEWSETVERVVDGNLALVDDRHQLPNERDDLIRMITEFKLIPAGRHLWASGVKNAQHLFNCWVSGWTDKPSEHFSFSFLRLMEGGGVGANYSNRYLADYPPVQQELYVHVVCDPEHPDYELMRQAGVLSTEYDPDWMGAFEIEDSREGWASALVDLIDTFYREDVAHYQRVYDVSRVRPAGSKLKTFGGTASGPLPLAKMLIDVCEILSEASDTASKSGGYLDGIAAMEIDHAIAQCVVAGGVRRSARMAMMHWEDSQIRQFINCKTDSGSHWTTNISVEVDAKFWEALEGAKGEWANTIRPNDITYANDIGYNAWDGKSTTTQGWAQRVLAAISEGMVNNGEPGFWDSSLSNSGEPNEVVCTNPCLTGDTVIATINGPRTFADLAESGEPVQVYSWDPATKTPVVRWMRRPHKTRTAAEILKVTFDSGLTVRCTPDHSFYTFRGNKVQAQDLKPGKSIRAFSASFDGSGHERVHGWDSKRNLANHQYTHRMIFECAYGKIPEGLVVAHLDHDASNNALDNLAVMTPFQHAQYDYPLRKAAGFDGTCANHKVVSVEPAGFADVYNGMVEDSHTYIVLDPEPVAGHMSGIVSANCGEITLEPWEPCNLGHINLAAFVNEHGLADMWELYKAHKLMTRFLIRATFADVSDPKSREVLDRNRRIGVGHLGVASYLAMTGRKYSEAPHDGEFRALLRSLSAAVDDAAAEYSHDLRIPVPVKKRTVAPTGTIAKMPGVSEGIHPIFSKYFVRRIRFSKNDEDQAATLARYAEDGYTVEDDLYAANTGVVAIPTKDSLLEAVEGIWGAARAEEVGQGGSPSGGLSFAESVVESAADLTLNEMLSFQALYQACWADNAVSFTANVDPETYTADDVQHTLRKFGGLLKGCTLFPQQSFEQAPYEQITKAEYEAAITKDVADGVDEECASGACPIR